MLESLERMRKELDPLIDSLDNPDDRAVMRLRYIIARQLPPIIRVVELLNLTVMMQPMAIVTEGGLVYGTLLTLVVVPCIYDAFNREKSMVEEEL